jgi:hypothetical protein
VSQTVKANKTLSNLKKASAALAIIMKLLASFFSQLSSRFVGWLTVSQLPQCALEDLPQEAEEARNREKNALPGSKRMMSAVIARTNA